MQLSVTAAHGDLSVTATAIGDHYAPDVLTDLATRATQHLIQTFAMLAQLADEDDHAPQTDD